MTTLSGAARAEYVRRMFDRIAPRYDLINTLMTFGRDRAWRRESVARLRLHGMGRVLDLGSGTGDLAFEVRRQAPAARVVAADFSRAMLRRAQSRPGGESVGWLRCDALRLPFAPQVFDGLVSGFLLRNVGDLEAAIVEQFRVLRPGGQWACLDTTPPRPGPLRPLVNFHLRRVIPLLGRIIAGDPEAYNYLPGSTEDFLPAEDLAARIRRGGFAGVGFVRRMLGTIAVHWAERPPTR